MNRKAHIRENAGFCFYNSSGNHSAYIALRSCKSSCLAYKANCNSTGQWSLP